VSGGKVYKINNQNFAGLKQHAGREVRLIGKMTGDTIRISTISATLREHRGEKSSL